MELISRTGRAGSKEVMCLSFERVVERPVDEGCPWSRGFRNHRIFKVIRAENVEEETEV
jgi:hypothetical protein